MSSDSRTVQWLVWGFLLLVILAISGAFIWSTVQPRVAEADGGQPLPVYGQVPDFTLTNQSGGTVSLADLRGQVWVADIIFTRCTGPCPEMTKRLSDLQAALPAQIPAKLVTLTTDPDFDTPSVMKKHAERFGAHPDRWYFLTGAKQQISRLARDGLKLTALAKEADQRETDLDLFIHSTQFVIVDKQGRLRGVVDSTEPGAQRQTLRSVNRLLREK